jgi:PAS domain S-box-containing protein
MPDTISIEKYASTACAVFKIDLKGRFVYVDDETEELFGLSREELFGKSLYDFLSPESHHLINDVFGRHARYELFYEAVPLVIRSHDGRFRRLEAVLTINFISGNPVNYQFILRLSEAAEISPRVNWENRLIHLLHDDPEAIEFDHVAETFCAAGGYSQSECYIPDDHNSLMMVGSYPPGSPDHTAPVYLEQLRESGRNRFSFIPEDVSRHEGFGDGRSEAVLCLQNGNEKNLIVRLLGPKDYHPSEQRIANVYLISGLWNHHFEPRPESSSTGEMFSLLGQAGDTLGMGLVIVNDDYETVYINETLNRITGMRDRDKPEHDFRKVYKRWKVQDGDGRAIPFDQSLFAKVKDKGEACSGSIVIPGGKGAMAAAATPIELADSSLYLFCLQANAGDPGEEVPTALPGNPELLSLVHDIRSPLITIDAFTRRLRTKHADNLGDDGTFLVDGIMENSRILREMIDGLNELSRTRTDREPPKDVYLKELIKDIITRLKAAYPDTNYRIKYVGGLPSISAPKRKLTTLLRNILDNAFKYTSAPESAIEIRYTLDAGWHRLSISDSGPGINPDYAKKVFSPFFRTPEAANITGSGLGLALAYDIVTSWGGKIWVDKADKPGATISFTLPPKIAR